MTTKQVAVNSPTDPTIQQIAGILSDAELNNTKLKKRASADEPDSDDSAEADEANSDAKTTSEIETKADETPKGDDVKSDQDEQGVSGSDEDQRITLDDLAKKLELEAKDLYDVDIPIGGKDEYLTLGEMKDEFKRLKKIESKMGDITLAEQRVYNERMRAVNEVANLATMMELTPQAYQQYQAWFENHRQLEGQKLFDAIPEWRDIPGKYESDAKAILSVVSEYGLTGKDVGNIVDHRWMKALKDLADLKAKVSTAGIEAKRIRKAPRIQAGIKATSAKSAQNQNLIKLAKGGNMDARITLINDILKG
jgi:hypothetical protein